MYITYTNPINFISAPNLLHFRSESVIIYIHYRIRNRSLSDPIRIREKNIVKDMVETQSDPIRSIYTPTNYPLATTLVRHTVRPKILVIDLKDWRHDVAASPISDHWWRYLSCHSLCFHITVFIVTVRS